MTKLDKRFSAKRKKWAHFWNLTSSCRAPCRYHLGDRINKIMVVVKAMIKASLAYIIN